MNGKGKDSLFFVRSSKCSRSDYKTSGRKYANFTILRVFKLLKATRQGNTSKEGFVVTHGNQTRGLSHRKPRTNQLCLDYQLSCSVLSVEQNARDTKMTTRVYNSLTKVLKPETARSANCANLCSFVFPPPTHGAYHKRSELINFTRKSIFPGLILLKKG